VRAGDLLRNPKNWRKHPKIQADALRGLLAEVGYADALLVRERSDGRLMIIDGHLRADTTPDFMVPVLVLDVTEEEADKILLTLDPLAAMAESDAERIKALLTTVRTDSEAVQELLKRIAGPRLWEILHPADVDEAAVALERADELRVKWGTESGQLWQISRHRIICGDCTDIDVVARLMGNDRPPLCMIWTDPPYGVDYGAKTDWTHQHGGGQRRRAIENDALKPAALQKLFGAALEVVRQQLRQAPSFMRQCRASSSNTSFRVSRTAALLITIV